MINKCIWFIFIHERMYHDKSDHSLNIHQLHFDTAGTVDVETNWRKYALARKNRCDLWDLGSCYLESHFGLYEIVLYELNPKPPVKKTSGGQTVSVKKGSPF